MLKQEKSNSSEVLHNEERLMASSMHENRFAKPMMKKNPEGAK